MQKVILHSTGEKIQAALKEALLTNKALSAEIETLSDRLSHLNEHQQKEVNHIFQKAEQLLDSCQQLQPQAETLLSKWAQAILPTDPFFPLSVELADFLKKNDLVAPTTDVPLNATRSAELPKMKAPESEASLKKIFLQIARKFHPDRAKNPEEEAAFHQIMLTANQAWNQKDWGSMLLLKESLESRYFTTIHEMEPPEDQLRAAQAFRKGLQQQLTQLFEQVSSIVRSQQTGSYKQEALALFNRMTEHSHRLTIIMEAVEEWFVDHRISADVLDQLMLAFGGNPSAPASHEANQELADYFMKEFLK